MHENVVLGILHCLLTEWNNLMYQKLTRGDDMYPGQGDWRLKGMIFNIF